MTSTNEIERSLIEGYREHAALVIDMLGRVDELIRILNQGDAGETIVADIRSRLNDCRLIEARINELDRQWTVGQFAPGPELVEAIRRSRQLYQRFARLIHVAEQVAENQGSQLARQAVESRRRLKMQQAYLETQGATEPQRH